jgi:tetratricopeptide (TPR) repeat protein
MIKLTHFRVTILFVILSFPLTLLFSQSDEVTKIFEQNRESVITFVSANENKVEIAKGTGFVVGQEILATNFHLISEAKDIVGKNFQGKKVKFEGVLASDVEHDTALLKIKKKMPPLRLGRLADLQAGQTVFTVGSNEVGEIVVNQGKVNRLLEISPGAKVADAELNVLDTFSGAPVFNAGSEVVGMVVFLDMRKKIVVPVDMISTLLKQSSLTKFKDWNPVEYFETFEGSYFTARVFYALEETAKAERFLKKVISQKPDLLDAHLLLSSVYLKQRNYASAVSILKKILELDPNRDDIHLDLGTTYLKMMRWQEAIPSLEKSFQLNSENKEAHFHIGQAYEELRDFGKAAEAYTAYLNSSPRDPQNVYVHLGTCQMETGQFEEAVVSFKEALKENPQDVKINYNQKAGQFDEAAEVYYLLAQLTPDDAKIYYNTITRMYDEAKMPEKAIESTERMIAADPGNSGAYYNLGYMYVKLDNFEKAIEAFNKVIEIDPDMEYAYLQLGFCYSKMKRHSKSVEALEKLVMRFPENSDGWMGIAIGNMQQKKFSAAIQPLEKVIELKPDSAVAYYNLAVVYLNLQDRYSARELYNKLKDIDLNLAKKLEKLF